MSSIVAALSVNEKVRMNHLLTALGAAVPLWSLDMTPETALTNTRDLSTILGEKGDVLQFGGKGCAEAFNALAEGLARLSFAPGGVPFLGFRWVAKEIMPGRWMTCINPDADALDAPASPAPPVQPAPKIKLRPRGRRP